MRGKSFSTNPWLWHGTLAITLPCHEGLVICADKRVVSSQSVVSDSEVKILQLGDKAAFTVTGLYRASSADVKVPDFDAVQCLKDSVTDINLNYLATKVNQVVVDLASRFEATLRTLSHPLVEPQQKGCQILIYHLDSRAELHGHRLDLEFDDTRTTKLYANAIPLDDGLLTTPSFAGECRPVTALFDRKRTDLEFLRNNQAFQRFSELVKKPGEWRSLTPNDAADIGRYLISASSELERADGAEVPSIGPVADCALLSPTRRFVWL